MTPTEIREKIDANNLAIELLLTPNNFVLNTAIRDLIKENLELQDMCPHKFVNGVCCYCDKEEK